MTDEDRGPKVSPREGANARGDNQTKQKYHREAFARVGEISCENTIAFRKRHEPGHVATIATPSVRRTNGRFPGWPAS